MLVIKEHGPRYKYVLGVILKCEKMRKDAKKREKTQKDTKVQKHIFLKAKRRKNTQKEAKSHKKIFLRTPKCADKRKSIA